MNRKDKKYRRKNIKIQPSSIGLVNKFIPVFPQAVTSQAAQNATFPVDKESTCNVGDIGDMGLIPG